MLTVITGPPCSGKTTYARQHAVPGDVVIDFDDLAQALGSTSTHDHDPLLREITAGAWAAAVNRAVRNHHRLRVWVIDSNPLPARRKEYDQAGARYVELAAEPAELHRRAEQDGRSRRWHAVIDQWLAGGPGREQRARTGRDPQHKAGTRW